MRPVHLVAQGFTAFRDRIDVDFDGVDFFALVGPTGSGKSSVIDAICFALYGCVPRYDDQRMVAPAISMGALEAKVSLTFEVGGRSYIATRVVRRTPTGASTREARLESMPRVAGDTEVLAGNVDELNREVERMLGLPFEYFTRCVMLPQGEFAKFLHDKPRDRQEVLVRLLNLAVYARMGERARALAEVGRNKIKLQADQLEQLAFATPDAETAAAGRVTRLGELRSTVTKATPVLERVKRDAAAADVEAAEAGRLVKALQGVGIPDTVTSEAAQLHELAKVATEAEEVYKGARTDRRRREEQANKLPKLTELQQCLSGHDQLKTCTAQFERAKASLGKAQKAEQEARAKAATAEAEYRTAWEGLEHLRRDHAAHELSSHLTVGAPCPVCLRVVDKVAKRSTPTALASADRSLERASRAQHEAIEDHRRLERQLSASDERVAGLAGRQGELQGEIADYPDRDDLVTSISATEAALQALQDARADEEARQGEFEDARTGVESAEAGLSRAWEDFDTQRDPLVHLQPPSPKRVDLATDWQVLTDWAVVQLPIQAERSASATAAAEELRADFARRLAELIHSCAEYDVTVQHDADVAEVRDAVVGAERDARHDLHEVRQAREQAARLAKGIAEIEQEANVAAQLGQLLSARGFENWLVAEALGTLVAGASMILQRLSGGQYSLVCDRRNEFLVVDHRNADETRPARTLSGGETFQASLALALALADQLVGLAAEGAARLESIFLDEGFGTLDAETLATVADTVETLGSEDRMVGLVTHVRDLAERVPVRYEVSKGSRTSTVERCTA